MNEIKYSHDEPSKQVRLIAFKDLEALFTNEFGEPYTQYRKAWQLAQQGDSIPSFPLSLDFETNNFCNLKCRMCLFSSDLYPDNKRPKGFLNVNSFKRLTDEGSEHALPAMTFGFESEPLLHPHLPQMVEYARSHGVMDIRVGTNGMLLDLDMSKRLIDSGLTRLEISVDAIDPQTYSSIRHGGDYYRLIKNIFTFLELRHNLGLIFPLLRVSFLKLQANEGQLQPFLNFWKNTADYFSIQNLLDYEILESEDTSKNADHQPTSRDFKCVKINQRMYIRYNLTSLPCGYVFGWEGLALADLHETSIYHAWNSAKFRELREIHACGKYWHNHYCKRCVDHTSTGGLDLENTLGTP